MKEERTFTEYGRVPVSYLRWPAIFGGTFFAFGIIAILSFFGLTIGGVISGAQGVTQGAQVWAGIWTLVTMFFGFFAGGWLAARASGALTNAVGRLHGLVVWGLGTAALLYFLVNSTTRLGTFLAGVTGNMADITARATTVESMTVTAGIWATIALICGLVGSLIGGHSGVQEQAVAPDIRRAA